MDQFVVEPIGLTADITMIYVLEGLTTVWQIAAGLPAASTFSVMLALEVTLFHGFASVAIAMESLL